MGKTTHKGHTPKSVSEAILHDTSGYCKRPGEDPMVAGMTAAIRNGEDPLVNKEVNAAVRKVKKED